MDELSARLREADRLARAGLSAYEIENLPPTLHAEAADAIDSQARRIAHLEAITDKEVTFRELETKMRDGTVDLRVVFGEEGGSPAARFIAALLLNIVLGDGDEPEEPPNYRSAEVSMKPAGEVQPIRAFLEVVKPDGKSSHELREVAERERDELRATVERHRRLADWVRQYEMERDAARLSPAAADLSLLASIRQSMFDEAEAVLADTEEVGDRG